MSLDRLHQNKYKKFNEGPIKCEMRMCKTVKTQIGSGRNWEPYTSNEIYFLWQLKQINHISWSIWKERNEAIFRNDLPNVFRIFRRAQVSYKKWSFRTHTDSLHSLNAPSSRHVSSTSPPPHHILVAWEAPPPNFFKLNFDGSVRNISALAEVIIRNS